jgi:uncharacterized protein (UPF0332 family)
MSTTGPNAEVVRYWWDKALESLSAARRECAAGAYDFAINRAYYALFYTVSALLLEEGHHFRKHSGVRAAFNRDIVKSGRLSRKHGELYNQLFRDRHEGDYIALVNFDTPYVQGKIDACEGFLACIRPLLKSLPPETDERSCSTPSALPLSCFQDLLPFRSPSYSRKRPQTFIDYALHRPRSRDASLA